jgi:hypothetical protein
MNFPRHFVRSLWVSLVFVSVTFAVALQTNDAPDATERGPFRVVSSEYKLPAAVDPDVLDVPPAVGVPRAVELWARVYRPNDLTAGPFPLVIFLHGNHATCGIGENPRFDDRVDYTVTGQCTPEYRVVPNHLGYAYLAERLASHGYIVVSINANRGITAGQGIPVTDPGLNLARGRLILRHLERLSIWNARAGTTPASLGFDMQGTLDFNYVGMMGHSRGGEGIRAAYNLYRDTGSPWPARIQSRVRFQGLFEIGPVDGQTGRVLNPDGLPWITLLPMCDGDVSNLQGARPLDRALRIFDERPSLKGSYTVWGANHNYYNTEWQVSDSGGCFGHRPLFAFTNGSERQQQTAVYPLLAFFRGNVGPRANPAFNRNFNPLYNLPNRAEELARVDRGYSDLAATYVVDDFDRPTGLSSWDFPTVASGSIQATNINLVTDGTRTRHDATQRVAVIAWADGGMGTYFQTVFSGGGFDASYIRTLDFRVSRRFTPSLNPDLNTPTDFSIQLVMGDGRLSNPVRLSRYADLRGPVGGAFGGNLHAILQTVRIPVRDFAGADLYSVKGVRFTFNQTTSGAIFVGNIRLSAFSDGFTPLAALRVMKWNDWVENRFFPVEDAAAEVSENTAALKSMRRVMTSGEGNRKALDEHIEIEVFNEDKFPVMDELPVLRIGNREFNISRYPDTGETTSLIFMLSRAEFAQLTDGEEVVVQYGSGAEANRRWHVGNLQKQISR